MAEFSAGLQTQQKERYAILLFLLLGGSFYEFFMTIALAIPPLTVKNKGGVRLFVTVRLIGRIRYLNLVYKSDLHPLL